MTVQTDCGLAMLKVGQPAPEFDLPDADMEIVSLSGFRNRKCVVLYFYARDDTPSCTLEALEFSDRQDDFDHLDAVVLGISMDDCLSHGSFRDKHGLSLQLLADVDGDVCRSYGVIEEKEHNGQKRTCIRRSTFIIDKRGAVKHALYGVNVRGHAMEVLKLIKGMGEMQIARNTVVSLHYELFDSDGELIEGTEQPIEYLHGGYNGIFAMVEKSLAGRNVGETCDVRLQPEDAFGEYDAELVCMEPRDKFPAKIEVGMQFQGESETSGKALVYTVTDVADGKVVVDGNHPLAGKSLRFLCTVKAVREATAEEVLHGHPHGPHGHHHH